MEVKYEAGFRIDDQPQVIVLAIDFDIGLIEVPFIGIGQDQLCLNELGDSLENGSKALDPAGDGDMGNPDLVTGPKQLSSFPGCDVGHEKTVECQKDNRQGMAHAFHGERCRIQCRRWRADFNVLSLGEGVVTTLVTAAIV